MSLNQINALTVLLADRKPYCFSFQALSSHPMQVSYMVTGVNEDQIKFSATQMNRVLVEEENQRDSNIEVRAFKNGPVDLCWEKLDRKQKKLNFLV